MYDHDTNTILVSYHLKVKAMKIYVSSAIEIIF